MSETYLKVTAWMATQIAGDVPFLDALLEFEMAQRERKAYKLQRHDPVPPYGEIHIPMLRKRVSGVLVACCSSPIIAPERESVEHFAKRLGVEYASYVDPSSRRVVATGNATYKSYRLPLHVRNVERIVWFGIAHRGPVLKLLKSVHSLGHKRSHGYGRVKRWQAEYVDVDYSWFAESERGRVLMRPLPLCDESTSAAGGVVDFGAVQAPYWHPGRYMDRVVPC